MAHRRDISSLKKTSKKSKEKKLQRIEVGYYKTYSPNILLPIYEHIVFWDDVENKLEAHRQLSLLLDEFEEPLFDGVYRRGDFIFHLFDVGEEDYDEYYDEGDESDCFELVEGSTMAGDGLDD